jgi:hypothetical protein
MYKLPQISVHHQVADGKKEGAYVYTGWIVEIQQ